MNFRRPGRIWIPEAPNLILGRGPCPRPTMELELNAAMRFEGWFDVKLIDAKTKRVKQHLRFKNLITDAALDGLGANSVGGLALWMGVGTGATPPTAADTVLQTPTGGRVSRGVFSIAAGPANAYYSGTCTALFLEATANGNLTEIGLFSLNAGGIMWTRQLFKDGTGTPTVVTKTAADQLQVTYEMRLYSPTVDVAGNVLISAVNYAFNSRAANINNSTTWGAGPINNWNSAGATLPNAYETDVLGTTSGNPGGTPNTADSMSAAAYVASSFRRDHSYIWEPANGNFATGIGSLSYGIPGGYGAAAPFQCNFAPKIPKTAVKRLTVVCRLSWARYP
jgi:hypothetical protein